MQHKVNHLIAKLSGTATLALKCHSHGNTDSSPSFSSLPRVNGTFAVLTMLSGMLLTSGCFGTSEPDSQQQATSSQTAVTPSYKVLTDADGMPFTFHGEMGDVEGFDIDLMNAIADDQGFSVEYEVIPWGLLMPSMREDKGDMAIGHISITDERKKVFSYSSPYFESPQLALVQPELADVTNFDELAGQRIKVQANTIFADLLDEKDIAYSTDPDIFPIIADLVNDDIDATVGDGGILLYYQSQYADEGFVTIEDNTVPKDSYGIIVDSTNTQLLEQVNQGLANLRQNGKYQTLYEKWFE